MMRLNAAIDLIASAWWRNWPTWHLGVNAKSVSGRQWRSSEWIVVVYTLESVKVTISMPFCGNRPVHENPSFRTLGHTIVYSFTRNGRAWHMHVIRIFTWIVVWCHHKMNTARGDLIGCHSVRMLTILTPCDEPGTTQRQKYSIRSRHGSF